MTHNKYRQPIIDDVFASSLILHLCLLCYQVFKFILKVLHCAVEDCCVVTGHVDRLVAGCEAVEDEELGVEVLYSRCYDYVGEDGQDLICIQHPFLFLEAISIVECFDFFGDAFGAGHD